MVEGKKMAKSLGNFFTLRDLLAKSFTGREIRYLLLTAHYRETFNFTMEGLQSARQSLARLDECLAKLQEVAAGNKGVEDPSLIGKFSEILDNDLNVSGAWGAIFEWVRDTNRRLADKTLDPVSAASALATWEKIDSVLAVGAPPEIEVPAEIEALMEARQAARKARDFNRADAIRDELKTQGWTIEDTPKGPRLRRI